MIKPIIKNLLIVVFFGLFVFTAWTYRPSNVPPGLPDSAKNVKTLGGGWYEFELIVAGRNLKILYSPNGMVKI